MCSISLFTYGSVAFTDMPPTLLSELSTRDESRTVKVKVLRIWDSLNLSTNEVITVDMILADKKVHLLRVYNLNGITNFSLF